MSRHEQPTVTAPAELVQAAAHGDEQAWQELVERYRNLMTYVARGFRLSEAQVADVVATSWLRLVEHIGSIRNGEQISSWLVTTVRRESLAKIREGRREQPVAEFGVREPMVEDAADAPVLGAERRTAVRGALAQLPPRQRELLMLLASEPEMPYADVSVALQIPIGSIGPTRARALTRLRSILESQQMELASR